jgi:hypothetical protein
MVSAWVARFVLATVNTRVKHDIRQSGEFSQIVILGIPINFIYPG